MLIVADILEFVVDGFQKCHFLSSSLLYRFISGFFGGFFYFRDKVAGKLPANVVGYIVEIEWFHVVVSHCLEEHKDIHHIAFVYDVLTVATRLQEVSTVLMDSFL